MAIVRFLVYSAIGVFAFFVPIELQGRSTILVDHVVTFATSNFPRLATLYCTLVIITGVVLPFVQKTWKQSRTQVALSLLQLLALPLTAMYLLDTGPDAIMQADILPFLFEKLAVPVGLIIPTGAVFLACLIGFGLLEIIGTLMESIMRPVWKTPGRSAIDAIASFVGSYSIGLLITNRVYKAGYYSAREAAIIATGFSTISATFMVFMAKTLGLSDMWNAYFWSCMLVTFTVTAITVRLPPLTLLDNTRRTTDDSWADSPDSLQHNVFRRAWDKGIAVAEHAEPLGPLVWDTFVDGLKMATRVLPPVLSIGVIGLLLAKYTPVFDALGYLLYPVVWICQFPEPAEMSSALATGLAEMFLPTIQAVDMPLLNRFAIAIVSVSSILFLSASIPCVLATDIPISVFQMLALWLLRTILSLPLAAILGHLFAVT